jgi:hypothetical protein
MLTDAGIEVIPLAMLVAKLTDHVTVVVDRDAAKMAVIVRERNPLHGVHQVSEPPKEGGVHYSTHSILACLVTIWPPTTSLRQRAPSSPCQTRYDPSVENGASAARN